MKKPRGGRAPGSALRRFWEDDRGLSVFSVLLLALVFVVPPLVPPGTGRSLVGDVLYALLLVSGVYALGERRLTRRVLLPVAVVTLAFDIAGWLVPVPQPWLLCTSLLSLLLFLAVVLGRTLRDGPITTRRLHGAAAAYLLLGLVWAYAYGLVEMLRPGAFTGPIQPGDGPRAFLYFSFVTLTTVGYGDILPVHPAARSLANLEAVTGSLYVAILVSRLVSLAVSSGEPRSHE